MPATTSVPVEEYLSATYRPDREYVDGVVLERNLGEYDHSKLQKNLLRALARWEQLHGVEALPEQRVQVAPTRFRVPDVCVLHAGHVQEQIITSAPLICFEILSKDDRMAQMQSRVNDYLEFGVPYVWILDPRERKAYRCTPGEVTEVREGILRTENPTVELALDDLFAVTF